MNKESLLIRSFTQASEAIGDDGILKNGWIYSKDLFCESVHFKRSWMSLRQIAYKAFAVNVSDAVAMNAVPKYALLGVTLPRSMSAKDVKTLGDGLVEAAAAFGCEIIGGDTVGGTKLDLSVTIISESKDVLKRTRIKNGDLIAYTGSPGRALKELRYLLAGKKPHANSVYVRPVLRDALIRELTPILSAGMDVSDGIYTDIERLARLNRIGFEFLKPLSQAIGCSGEEYEMLIAFPPRQRQRVLRLACKHRVNVTVFAKAARKTYRNPCKSHHF